MWKRFSIITCEKADNSEVASEFYNVGLCSYDEPNVAIYFPVQEEEATLISFLLNPEDEDLKPNTKMLGLYKTMEEGFEASGTFVSGIILGFEKDNEEDILSCQVYLSKVVGGCLESVMKMPFPTAIILATMHEMDVFMNEELVNKIVGDSDLSQTEESKDDKSEENSKKFPVDKNISKIAKSIMSGKVKKTVKKSPKGNSPKGNK